MRVKLYDTDPNVLSAFANTDVEFFIGLGNEHLQRMADPQQAQAWIEQHVQPYHTQTKITCITVGNKVLTGTDMQLKSYLLPTMQGVYRALVNLGLDREIFVAHPHSAGILGNSFPPFYGSFRQVAFNSPAK
ncbi:Glucan endo-1,3-beta-glucosidase 11 [Capsicum chinense]|nr:Glucan endo-1,3-beta-glucosidase 11 [Capsicum chinense]